jgi:integration host factor subunit beta
MLAMERNYAWQHTLGPTFSGIVREGLSKRSGVTEMTKADLVEEISKDTGLSKKDTNIVVNLIIDNLIKALAEGDKVELRGFGSFKVKSRKSRKARNPRTGSSVEVPAKLVPYFKASNELKALVNK